MFFTPAASSLEFPEWLVVLKLPNNERRLLIP
jgi:hypothetical protein